MILKEPDTHKQILKGLVLAGGKSTRMGEDKGQIKWHTKEQRYHMADILNKFCTSVFISCRQDQREEINSNKYKTIVDTYEGLAAYGAILSAFENQQDAAWLVIACDLPLVDESTIKCLIANRNTSKIATTFQSPYNNLPEPLITIWEPQSYSVLLSFLSEGNSCPRKALIKSSIHVIQPPDAISLLNANTPSDAEKVKQILSKKNIDGKRLASI